jgi:phenylacetaldehyde dehydrogenase
MSTATVEIPTHQHVLSFVGAPRKMLIGGKWLDAASGKTFPTYNPATGEVLAHVAEGNSIDVDKAIAAARKAFEGGPWRTLSASERGRLIWKLADLLESHLEEFAQLESLDNGKPVGVARAADVPLAVDHFRYMAGWATKIEGNTIPLSVPYTPGARYHAYTLREPVGVVAQIIPWNFPLLMAAWKLGPALAAGCTIVLQDSLTGWSTSCQATGRPPARRLRRTRTWIRSRSPAPPKSESSS